MTSNDNRAVWDAPLEALEQSLIDHAATGELLDLRADILLAEDQPAVDLEMMQAWGPGHTIRAKLLRHLLTASQWPVHTKGVQLRGARIVGPFDLEFAALRCPLVLETCYFDSNRPVVLAYATGSLLRLRNCQLAGLNADRLVTQELDLEASSFTGAVRLVGASVTGLLSCRGARITLTGEHLTGEHRQALIADRVKVGDHVYLDEGFVAHGEVRLPDAVIAGSLSCRNAQITDTGTYFPALVADGVKIGGGVFLDHCTADGSVSLVGASIEGPLSFRNALITETDIAHRALVADAVKIGGGILLEDFKADGAVWLVGADTAGNLDCRDASISGDGKGRALVANSVRVGGDVFLGNLLAGGAAEFSDARVDGSLVMRDVEFSDPIALMAEGARIGQHLVWAPERPVTGLVSLERAQVHSLDDDWSNDRAYWPPAKRLRLAGFVYDGFGGTHHATWRQRLNWIRSQIREPVPGQPARFFDAQPYEQLARIYRQAGQDTQARRIAIARRSDMRRVMSRNRLHRAGNSLLDMTIRSGSPGRAIGMLLIVYLGAWVFFGAAQHQPDLMVPTQVTSSMRPAPSARVCTANYPCFYPAGYAIDSVMPLVSVGQAENWRPNGAADWGWVYVYGTWVITGLGWAFSTLTVAFYTGLARTD